MHSIYTRIKPVNPKELIGMGKNTIIQNPIGIKISMIFKNGYQCELGLSRSDTPSIFVDPVPVLVGPSPEIWELVLVQVGPILGFLDPVPELVGIGSTTGYPVPNQERQIERCHYVCPQSWLVGHGSPKRRVIDNDAVAKDKHQRNWGGLEKQP